MTTAEAVLQRLLLMLPVAHEDHDPDGASIDDVARDLGVAPKRILRDIQELERRAYYLPAGLGDQIQLRIRHDRVSVWTKGEFARPVRLTAREALALELGLRILTRGDRAPEMVELGDRLILPLRMPAAEASGSEPPTPDPKVGLGALETVEDAIQATVDGAARERRALELEYRSPGKPPEDRRVAPLVLAHAEGRWYLLARDLADQSVRAFRMDRILGAEPTDEIFEPRDSDDDAIERFFRDGRVHDGGAVGPSEPIDALVAYSPAIARWVREAGWEDTREMPDGGVRIGHTVHDPEWIIRHVLGYGPDAWVVEPTSLRERLAEVARGLERSHSESADQPA